MLKLLTKVLGTKSERDIKALSPVVELVNAEFEKLAALSDDQLRGQTAELKSAIAEALGEIDKKITDLQAKTRNDALDVHQKEDLFAQIDKLEEDRNDAVEKVLDELLSRAFAVVKETARRFKNGGLTVQATDMDRELDQKSDALEIVGGTAQWKNSWSAAGTKVTWEMVHFDVQLMGGSVLHQGKIAEMATGEGKTLVSTLPAYLNALVGRGVHIVTVNDYLARRDMEWMAPIFQFHGLRVDCIDMHRPGSFARKKAYEADITYGTNNEFGFDYLRDNMATDTDELVQRRHHYAMVDEVDSVLVDDARTPLIISGPVPRGDEHEFHELRVGINKVVEAQKKLCNGFLNEAKKLLAEGKDKEGGLALFRAYRGLPGNKPLIKFLGEPGMRQLLQKTENTYIAEQSKLMPEADAPLFFTIEERNNNIELTEKGIDLIADAQGEDESFFMMPDISIELHRIEQNTSISTQERLEQKEKLIDDYGRKSSRIHSINQLLKAYCMFERDVDYIVVDGKVKIVDEQTGRVMEGRRYSDGLHQALEAKENVKVEDATQTYATVTLQNYFRMYHKLAGMTGTAETEAGELWEIYKLDVVVVPTNRVISRDDKQDLVYRSMREKFNAVIEEVEALREANRPVLVGTTSVEVSELLSRMLQRKNIPHNVLNAKQHAREAQVVAEAGLPKQVTIATNMAGRGTDIKLTPESKAAGGLAIIGTERHESRRVDRQLRGRAGRQGDPGSSQFYVSLEDNLMRLFGGMERISKIMDRLGFKEGEVLQHSMITRSIERAQKKVEENNFGIRKRLLEYDDVMNSQREVIYKRRRNALYGDRLELDVLSMIYDVCEQAVELYQPIKDFESYQLKIIAAFGMDSPFTAEAFEKESAQKLIDQLFDAAVKSYRNRQGKIVEGTWPGLQAIHRDQGATVKEVVIPFQEGRRQISVPVSLEEIMATSAKSLPRAIEKTAVLSLIDHEWKEHLREMDDLRHSVQTASYEQKDPLLIYKFEAFEIFKNLLAKLAEDTSSFLYRSEIPRRNPNEIPQAQRQRRVQQVQENKAEAGSMLSGGPAPQAASGGGPSPAQTQTAPRPENREPVVADKLPGRNDRVSVQYVDGSVKRDVKFKTVEQDVLSNRCVVIENETA